MSEWHRKKQGFFDEKYQEIVVKNNGKIHRADILKDGVVIEFQHSPISLKEFQERNEFYITSGYKIAWIFDITDAVDNGQLYYTNFQQKIMKWSRAKSVLKTIVPSDNRRDLSIWISWDNELPHLRKSDNSNSYYGNFIQKIIWSSKDIDNCVDYKRIMLSKHPIELKHNMDCRQLFYSKTRTRF